MKISKAWCGLFGGTILGTAGLAALGEWGTRTLVGKEEGYVAELMNSTAHINEMAATIEIKDMLVFCEAAARGIPVPLSISNISFPLNQFARGSVQKIIEEAPDTLTQIARGMFGYEGSLLLLAAIGVSAAFIVAYKLNRLEKKFEAHKDSLLGSGPVMDDSDEADLEAARTQHRPPAM